MITKMTGILVRVLDEEARVVVGPFEYQVLITEANRRALMFRIDTEITLHISEYFEGNQSGTRFVPRKLGFLTEVELEFFDLFCTVDKIGAKKALKAMCRGVRDIADAINRQDAKWLTTLPGIGPSGAEQIIATLRKKIAPFLTSRADDATPVEEPTAEKPKATRKPKVAEAATLGPAPKEQLIEDIYAALMGLGMNPAEARDRIDGLIRSGKPFATHSDAITLIFSTKG